MKLKVFEYNGFSPVPLLVASALQKLSSLNSLSLMAFGAESLPSFANFTSLASISIDCQVFPPSPQPAILPYAPITIANEPRRRFAKDPERHSGRTSTPSSRDFRL